MIRDRGYLIPSMEVGIQNDGENLPCSRFIYYGKLNAVGLRESQCIGNTRLTELCSNTCIEFLIGSLQRLCYISNFLCPGRLLHDSSMSCHFVGLNLEWNLIISNQGPSGIRH